MSVRVCLCWFVVMSFLGSVPSWAAEVLDGRLEKVSGDVEVQKRGWPAWVRAFDGMKIGPGDQISTGINGRAVLRIRDSRTDISSLTQFVVGRAVESANESYTELFLRMGKVVSQVPKKAGELNRFNVVTPTAVVGVRGTEQTVGHFPGIGTQANIRDGKGFAAPVPAEALPAPAQAVLGIAPAKLDGDGGGDNGKGNDKDKKKKKKEKGTLSDEGEETDKDKGKGEKEEAGAVEDAVEGFNQWLDQLDLQLAPDAGMGGLGLLDDKTFEYVVPVDDGLRISVGEDREDPGAFIPPTDTLKDDAQPDITPSGLSEAEQEEAHNSIEASDQPESISADEDQSSFKDVTVNATTTSTLQGGVPPSSAIVPPALPDNTGQTNVQN